jgi:hypothetical protein
LSGISNSIFIELIIRYYKYTNMFSISQQRGAFCIEQDVNIVIEVLVFISCYVFIAN